MVLSILNNSENQNFNKFIIKRKSGSISSLIFGVITLYIRIIMGMSTLGDSLYIVLILCIILIIIHKY